MEMNLSSQRFRFNHLNIICFAFSVSFLAVFFLPSYAEAHIFPWWQRSCCWVFFFDFGAPKGLHRFFFEKKTWMMTSYYLVSDYFYTCTTSEPCFNWKGPSFGAETTSRYCIYLYLSLFLGGSIHENPNILLDFLDQKSSNVIPTLIKWYS